MLNKLVVVCFVLICASACSPSANDDQRRDVSNATKAVNRDRAIGNAFPDAVSVRLFVNTEYGDDGLPIYGKPRGLLLSDAQRAELQTLIKVHRIEPDRLVAMCFVPHHFFRYYDRSGKVVGELRVCFCCAGVGQSGPSPIRLREDEDLYQVPWGLTHGGGFPKRP